MCVNPLAHKVRFFPRDPEEPFVYNLNLAPTAILEFYQDSLILHKLSL